MASIASDPGGTRRVIFFDPSGKRRAIYLGKVSKRDAEAVRLRVENLLSTAITGSGVIDRDTSVWLSKIDPKLKAKLVNVGLLEPPPEAVPKVLSPTLKEFTDDFIEKVGGGGRRKPGSVAQWRQIQKILLEKMPVNIRINEITRGHASAYYEAIKAGRASLTIAKNIRISKQFFAWGVDWEKIPYNPFDRIKATGSSARSNVEVPREAFEKILKVCDIPWKCIAALSRYGGLRTPSETLSIKWEHVDWTLGRMTIPVPKLEHLENRGTRVCPLFPELRVILEEAYASRDGEKDDGYIVDKPIYRAAANTGVGWRNCNLRTKFLKRLARAKVEPWPRLFHSMRASRETELEKEFGIYVACAWIGNSPKVAQKSYILVTEDDFKKALGSAKSSADTASKGWQEQAPESKKPAN